MAGLINVAYFRSFNPVAGQFRELDGIAAVIIGGGSIFGGYGTIIGALAGAAVITLVRALLQLNVQGFTMPQQWINVFIGVILIGAVLIDIWVRQANIIGRVRELFLAKTTDRTGSRQCLSRTRRSRSSRCGTSKNRSAPCRALRDVDLTLYPGEILGLVGDNSAGKSTLMKIMTGAYQRDSGEILVAGKPVHFKSPHESRDVGIEMIYQDFALCGNMDVGQNIFLGRWPRRGLFVNRRKMYSEADQVLKRLKVDVNSVYQRVESLSGGRQQSVAIARAISFEPRVVILDEPTANLSVMATERLLETMLELKKQGVAQIIISHRLVDIFAVGDRVMVLKRGENVGDRYVKNTDEHEVLEIIVSGTRESRLFAADAARRPTSKARALHGTRTQAVADQRSGSASPEFRNADIVIEALPVEAAIASRMVDERRAIVGVQSEDVADEDGVIAAIVADRDPRRDAGARIGEDRHRAEAFELDFERRIWPAGEMLADIELGFGEDAHAEMLRRHDVIVHARAFGDRDDAERRLERARHEGVRGHAAHLIAVADGDHGHAGREASHDAAELAWVDVEFERVVHVASIAWKSGFRQGIASRRIGGGRSLTGASGRGERPRRRGGRSSPARRAPSGTSAEAGCVSRLPIRRGREEPRVDRKDRGVGREESVRRSTARSRGEAGRRSHT